VVAMFESRIGLLGRLVLPGELPGR
jgi:hypothetical protein